MPREQDIGSLDKYWKKRNFSATPEPRGRRAKAQSALRFVIQKHAASHLHYDFRLELDGTLKSWAIPKGPSLDPSDKRLAMHVEDHPLDYADFEGVIPPGNYGAGTVIVWDNGEWEPIGDPEEGYRKGRLKFALRGKKLHGIWNLVKAFGRDDKNKNAWFLIKHRDDAAKPASEYSVVEAEPDSVLSGESGRVWKSNRNAKTDPPARKRAHAPRQSFELPEKAKKAPLPLMVSPQLAMLADHIPTTGKWIYEVKYDGYRLLTRIDEDSIRLFTRNGNDWTAKLPHLVKALSSLNLKSGWIDGEIVMLDKEDRPSFQQLQNAFENSRTEKIRYYIFDLLYADGHDLRQLPMSVRRESLEKLSEKLPSSVALSATFDVPPKQLFAHACEMKLEGLIGKRADAPYQSARSRDWIKLKCIQRQEFVIGGYTDPTGSRTGAFGSLLLGVHDPKTGKLRYTGRVGTGFTDTSLRMLTQKFKSLARETMPFEVFTGEKPNRAMHWLEPKLVCEVAFSEWTAGGHLRHPSFQGLRSDKPANAITQENKISVDAIAPQTKSASKKSTANKTKSKTTTKKAQHSGNDEAEIEGIVITHPERIIDSAAGITKLDLVNYYAAVADLILPHLSDRPVSLVRAPAGVDGQHFFQKHLDSVKIPHLHQLPVELFPGHPPLLSVDNKKALIACAQMNVVEFHTWNARADAIDTPDRMVFDLDPGEGIVWEQILQATALTKTLLDEIGLPSFLKTSGGKGLHIVVPIKPEFGWDPVKDFSAAIVQHLAKTLPQLFVAKSGPRNRVNRIFADYLRNGYAATTASAFSARVRRNLGVSVPLAWKELDSLTGSAQWTVRDADVILKRMRKDPWKDFYKSATSIVAAAEHLGFELAEKNSTRR